MNESSTEDDTKKAYRSLDRRFHPDKNQHSQVFDVMQMINEAKEELKDTFCHNDAMREEEFFRMDAMISKERVCMAHNTIIYFSESSSSDDSMETSSGDSYDSGKSQILTKPVILSNKSSTFPAKHKSDKEERPLKQPHQNDFTSKQETLEGINRLPIKCGFLDT